jgi:hypothetical protein
MPDSASIGGTFVIRIIALGALLEEIGVLFAFLQTSRQANLR